MPSQDLRRLVGGSACCEQVSCLFQNAIPDLQLERLVCGRVGVGNDVEPDHLVGQGGLLSVQPYPHERGNGHPQKECQLPPAELLIPD